MNTPLNEILAHLSDEDRANHLKAVSDIGTLFADQNTIVVDPQTISELPAVRTHVLSGGEIALDVEGCIEDLKNEPSINTKLIAAAGIKAEMSKIQSDIEHMNPQQRCTYARANGLHKPWPDTTASMTANEHQAILAGLNPSARIAYARRHGLV